MGMSVRSGIHVGEVEMVVDDLAGIGVHITARIADAAADGEIWVSRAVRDLVEGSGISFEKRGVQDLAGLDAPWELLAVAG
jgi:class 3 adenylate cyclase